MSAAGDPGRRSPAEVDSDPAYERPGPYQPDEYYPGAVQHVRLHRASMTYWCCVYAVRVDDSDYDQPATWYPVAPVVRTITKFVRVA